MGKWCGIANIGHNNRCIMFKYECSSCELYEYDMCANNIRMTTRTKETINRMIDVGIWEGSLKINEDPQLHWKYKEDPPIEEEPDWLIRRMRRFHACGGIGLE